jgi:hypothetical protein
MNLSKKHKRMLNCPSMEGSDMAGMLSGSCLRIFFPGKKNEVVDGPPFLHA